MAQSEVEVQLNQQQWELVKQTIERGVAATREELFKMALDEFWNEDFAGQRQESR